MSKEKIKEMVVNTLKCGTTGLVNLALDLYDQTITKEGQKAFSEAIGVGIDNTITCLYAAKVPDQDIIRVVSTYWGLLPSDVEDRLIWEKSEAPIRNLKQYMRLHGSTESEIQQYMKQNAVIILHNKELWKFTEKPEKLLNEIQKINESRMK